MGLKEYERRRDFSQTPEPSGREDPRVAGAEALFVIQMHHATRLHWDLRLLAEGTLKSWAVPKEPTLDPTARRLAVAVEDHPIAYGDFEGVIPEGNYGAGVVMVWDRGTYRLDTEDKGWDFAESLRRGHLLFALAGQKLRGRYSLVQTEEKSWIWTKRRDAHSDHRHRTFGPHHSVISGRTLEEIKSEAPARQEVWQPAKAESAPLPAPSLGAALVERAEPRLGPASEDVAPMKPARKRAVTLGDGWVFEVPPKGQRLIVGGRSAGLWAKTMFGRRRAVPPWLGRALAPLGEITLDGILAEAEEIFWISDLLHHEGADLRDLPLGERRERLGTLELAGELRVLPQAASTEGVPAGAVFIAKDEGSPYRGGVQGAWLEVRSDEEPAARLTHPERRYWPQEGWTKGDLWAYYEEVAGFILPYLRDRCLSLNRYPQGIEGPSFYQKDMTGYVPPFVRLHRLPARGAGRTIHYVICDRPETLMYLVNLGCIEFHPWLSRLPQLDEPDLAVIDIDPSGQPFPQVREIAAAVAAVLAEIGLTAAAVKTSGATGIHIAFGLLPGHSFGEVVRFTQAICSRVVAMRDDVTLERNPARRGGRVYLDCLQNSRGQTLAAPYCVRPRPGAPVSTPVTWEELAALPGPEVFTMQAVPERLKQVGDLWAPIRQQPVRLEPFWKALGEEPAGGH